jgi:hypothetical protein
MRRIARLNGDIPGETPMQFVRNGDLYQVVRITGPSHNVLGIEFADPSTPPMDAVIEVADADLAMARLDLTEVRDNVLRGVQDANAEFATNFVVRRIRFVPTDSPPSETYHFLARSIVGHLAKGEPFGEGTKSHATST